MSGELRPLETACFYERFIRRQTARAKEVVCAAAKLIRSASGDCLDVAAGVAAARRIVERRLDDEFLERVACRHGKVRCGVCSDRICVDAVDLDGVARRSLTVYADAD